MNKSKKNVPLSSRRGRIPASEVQDRKDRLLDAATEAFLEAGFDRATVTTIAKKAGCSLETLYTAYPTKEKMFGALITRKASGVFEAIGTLSPDRDLNEALLRYASEMVVLMEKPDTKGLTRLVIGESLNFPEVAKNFWKEGYARGIEVLAKYFAARTLSGNPPIANPMHAAEVFLALLLGDMTMRSMLGLKTLTDTKRQQRDWAESTVGLFVSLVEQGKL